MNIQERDIADITPYSKNAKKHPKEQVKKIAASIQRFGFRQPVVVDKKGVIVIGHGRVEAAKELGMTTVPVTVADDLTDKEISALRLADNKLNESEWDMELVSMELGELDEELKELTGFPAMEVLEAQEDDFDTTPPEEPKSKLGDLYQLGEHRLLCGDATKLEDVERLMDGEKADMVFTDPPYRMAVEGGSNQMVGRAAAKLGDRIKDLCDFDPADFLATLPTLFSDGVMNSYIFCNKDLVPDYLNWAIDCGYNFNILFWKKPNAIPLGGNHRPDVEYLLLFRKSAKWNNALEGVNYSKCLEFGRDSSTIHPTMKPIELIANEVKISSDKEDVVFDAFGGSGSTLIACEQTGRKCRTMELDPKYCDVIVARWEKLTGKKAQLIT